MATDSKQRPSRPAYNEELPKGYLKFFVPRYQHRQSQETLLCELSADVQLPIM